VAGNEVDGVLTMAKQGQLVLVGAKVNPLWKQQLDDLAQARGQTPSDIVREAIGAYLKLKPEERDQSLAHRVKELEKKFLMLTQLMKR
jgi:predicted DNA-binding protein